MSKHVLFRILAALVLLAALAGIGFVAFRAGLAHGAAMNTRVIVDDDRPDLPRQFDYTDRHKVIFRHHFHPFLGFGCFGILLPLFLFFIALAALRHLLWGPRWGWGGWGHPIHNHGPWGDGVPPMFAEWHRRAHAGQDKADDKPSADTDEK